LKPNPRINRAAAAPNATAIKAFGALDRRDAGGKRVGKANAGSGTVAGVPAASELPIAARAGAYPTRRETSAPCGSVKNAAP
jgi:hypothetical protein